MCVEFQDNLCRIVYIHYIWRWHNAFRSRDSEGGRETVKSWIYSPNCQVNARTVYYYTMRKQIENFAHSICFVFSCITLYCASHSQLHPTAHYALCVCTCFCCTIARQWHENVRLVHKKVKVWSSKWIATNVILAFVVGVCGCVCAPEHLKRWHCLRY